ncbi:MAG: AMP-binding protein, partial [Acetobacteraceae bacterium]|nr:AMP-binding protein [Acetobacteraceae bacterium]
FPYALFSATAGELSDAKDKARLIRILKLLELGLMSLAALGFLLGSLPILLSVLVGLGVQAAFFGPLKYGILPDHLRAEELLSGNAVIEATTFIAILAGTIAGGWLVLPPHNPFGIAFLGLGASVVGALAALAIPPAPPRAKEAADWHILRATRALLRATLTSPGISEPVLGISWFWTLGALLVAAFPVTAKLTLGASDDVVSLFLTAFSLGVGIGSLASAWILHGKASARDAPLALLGISFFAWDFAARALQARGLTSVAAILGSADGWRILLDLVLLAACGGFYSVPLYTLLQERAEPAWRARVMAANNVLNAAFMVGGAVIAAGLSAGGVAAPRLLMLTALVNLLAVLWSIRLVPAATMLRLLRAMAKVFYRASISGLDHYPPPDERAVVVPNHFSYIDGPLLAAFLPDQPVFAVDVTTAQRWWARPFLRWARIITVDPQNPFAVRSMIEAVKEGQRLVVFPEGRISTTGGLMKIYDGAGMIADRAQAKLVPVRIEGTEFSPFSHLAGKLRRRWFPRVRITVFPPLTLSLEPLLFGRPRRHAAAEAVYQAMRHAAFAAEPLEGTLFAALREAPSRYGWRLGILRDAEHAPVDYRRILAGAATLGRALAKETAPGEHVGLLVPNSLAAVIAFMGLQAFGRIPAVLNLTVGAEGWLSACRTAQVRRVISSRRFAEHGRLQKDIAQAAGRISFLWLEDLAASLNWRARIRGLYDSLWRARRLPGYRGQADAPAVVLFTSGTEGTPKGVVLSHRNILANCAQAAAVVDFTSADRVFNALPMFHAFGLTVGTLLPLFRGVPNFLYPSPLHYRLVPELIYSTDTTIVFGTDTFLAGWARYAHPYDFRSVRYVFAGAERVR